MLLRENNEGMTLIELIISMAITAIVLTMIVMMINTAARSFRKTNEDVNLQMEAQLVINQLNTMIMEGISIEAVTTEPSPNTRYVITTPRYFYGIVHDDLKSKLYLVQIERGGHDISEAYTATYSDAANLLAEYVDSITIIVDGKRATINLSMRLGDDTYSLVKKVTMRNNNG